MKTLFKLFIALILIIFLSTIAFVYFSLDSVPRTVQVNQIDASSAKHSQVVLKRIVDTVKQSESINSIIVTQPEVNGLTALLNRAVPQITADVRLSKYGAAAEASIKLPLPKFIQYLNVNAYILPSKEGLKIDEISIGDISINGDIFLSLTSFMVNYFVQDELAEKVLTSIAQVDITSAYMKVDFSIDKALVALKKEKSLLLSLRDDLALFGDVEKISFYYQALSDFAKEQPKRSSIAVFVQFMFDLAKMRTNISGEYSAVKENHSAITALAIYFGADKFELLVGNVIIRDHKQLVVRNKLRNNVTLQGRVDLQKHFIYSMALQLFSNHSASDAIGEFKEFLDTNKGGSGFSFADLQADRAGTRLAMIVTHSERKAKAAQNILISVTDQQLLPDIKGLDEGLDEKGFDKKFKDVKSSEYQKALIDIDNRLKSLAIYQLGWK